MRAHVSKLWDLAVLLLLIVAALALAAFVGCSPPARHNANVIYKPGNATRFKVEHYDTEYGPRFWTYTDTETGLEYIAVHECGVARIKRDDD